MPRFLVLILVLLVPVGASAERFIDLYGGWAYTQDDDSADVKSSRPIITDDAEFDDSPVVGLRLGGWLEQARNFGGALDGSWFEANGSGGFDGVDVRAFPISALLMVRLPLLESDEHPNGVLQPYLAAGPSLLVSEFRLKPAPEVGKLRDTSIDPGLDARLGASFFFAPGLGVFLEYRFTYFKPIWEDQSQGVGARVRSTLATHRAQLGVTLRY